MGGPGVGSEGGDDGCDVGGGVGVGGEGSLVGGPEGTTVDPPVGSLGGVPVAVPVEMELGASVAVGAELGSPTGVLPPSLTDAVPGSPVGAVAVAVSVSGAVVESVGSGGEVGSSGEEEVTSSVGVASGSDDNKRRGLGRG